MSPNFLENVKCVMKGGGEKGKKKTSMRLNLRFFLCKVRFGKVSNDIIFSPFKTEQNPRWDVSMPRAEFPRIMEHVTIL